MGSVSHWTLNQALENAHPRRRLGAGDNLDVVALYKGFEIVGQVLLLCDAVYVSSMHETLSPILSSKINILKRALELNSRSFHRAAA